VTITDATDRNAVTVVFRGVPAQVCENCGEEFVDETVTRELLKRASAVRPDGEQVHVQRYTAA
jgi:YgiT-type zinc finger domain-containing protein